MPAAFSLASPSFILLVSLVASTCALVIPSPQILSVVGDKRQDGYIVKFRDGVDHTSTMDWFKQNFGLTEANVEHEYPPSIFNGFSGRFDAATAQALTTHADIESVSEDAIWSASPLQSPMADPPPQSVKDILTSWKLKSILEHKPSSATSIQDLPIPFSSGPPARWNLYSVSHKDSAPSMGPYDYTAVASGGQGVDAYVLDTGIYVDHSEFSGRARWGTSFVGGNADKNGHGTHVSATIGGNTFGVASRVSLIAVQVLNGAGQGPISGIIAGISWAVVQAKKSGRPSVINLSLKGQRSVMLDTAVKSAIAAGVHVCAAAGNSNDDASKYSPGRVAGIITVGASDSSDRKASFSSYGPIVDIFAPGVSVTSAWIGSTTATHILSGTSQATPHVAGVVALILSSQGQKSPSDMSATIQSLAKTSTSGLKVAQVPL